MAGDEVTSHYGREYLQTLAFAAPGAAYHPASSRTYRWLGLSRWSGGIRHPDLAANFAGGRRLRRAAHRSLLQTGSDPRASRPDNARGSSSRALGRGFGGGILFDAGTAEAGGVVLSCQFF